MRPGSVIWAVGYRRQYGWVQVPMFDGNGYPTHLRGVTDHPGLYLLGLPWQAHVGIRALLGCRGGLGVSGRPDS